jgi:hypothetical protein
MDFGNRNISTENAILRNPPSSEMLAIYKRESMGKAEEI